MAKAETFFELLDSDLRLLSAEAKKVDAGFANQLGSLFATSDHLTPIKDSCERALARLRGLANSGRKTMDGIRSTPVGPAPMRHVDISCVTSHASPHAQKALFPPCDINWELNICRTS